MKRVGFFMLMFAVLALGTATACESQRELTIPSEKVPVPVGKYGSVLRFADGRILLSTIDSPSYKSGRLRYYSITQEQFVDVPVPADPRCRKTQYISSTALPDGTLGFNMICHGYWPNRPLGGDGASFIVSYDWESGEIKPIVAEPLPYRAVDFSWNPEMTRGVQGIGSLLSTIYWITPTGMKPMTVTIGAGEQSWSLDENLVAMNDERLDNTDVGIARTPVWSPDGRLVAFWASTDVIGRSGMSRARGSYGLYLLDPRTFQLQKLLENVRNTTRPVWSPDSHWLVFAGDRGSSRDSLWLTDLGGGPPHLVGKGNNFDIFNAFNGWGWLSDREIIVTMCVNPDCEYTEVIKYDVRDIVGSAQN
jgi:hypothetical protein